MNVFAEICSGLPGEEALHGDDHPVVGIGAAPLHSGMLVTTGAEPVATGRRRGCLDGAVLRSVARVPKDRESWNVSL